MNVEKGMPLKTYTPCKETLSFCLDTGLLGIASFGYRKSPSQYLLVTFRVAYPRTS